MKKFMAFLSEGKKYYGVGVLRIVFGVIMLLAGPEARSSGVVFALGAVFIVSGAVVFVIGEEKIKALFGLYREMSELTLRLLSLIGVGFGALILFAA